MDNVLQSITPYGEDKGAKKLQVARMFNNISPTYDALNRLLSFGIDIYWRNVLTGRLKKQKPAHILDVATGTADLAIAAASVKPQRIIGVDISEGMLAVGRKKVARHDLQSIITLVAGDSERLQFSDASFDAVTVAFGVRNFEHLEEGLAEMRRVLRPGGQLYVLEFGTPPNAIVRALYQFYSATVLPTLGRLLSKDKAAYSYLPASVKAFPSGSAFTEILKRVGFSHATSTPLSQGICMLYQAGA